MVNFINNMCGDNINSVHKMKYLMDHEGIIVCYCERCKLKFEVKPQDNKTYRRLFKRDTLQPHENLYYKEYPNKMNII